MQKRLDLRLQRAGLEARHARAPALDDERLHRQPVLRRDREHKVVVVGDLRAALACQPPARASLLNPHGLIDFDSKRTARSAAEKSQLGSFGTISSRSSR